MVQRATSKTKKAARPQGTCMDCVKRGEEVEGFYDMQGKALLYRCMDKPHAVLRTERCDKYEKDNGKSRIDSDAQGDALC